MSDSLELLARVQQGDREAIEVLLKRNLPGLRGYVRLHGGQLVRSKESSGDIVQSVCREVLQHIDRFQYPSEAGFRQWLYITAMRKIRKRYEYWGAQRRDAGREVTIDAETSEAAGPDVLDCYATFCTPSQQAIAREEIARIEAAFDRLPEDSRDAIVMARIVGLSRREIGKRLGRSELAVRALLSRSLARLAEMLDDEDEA